MKIVLATSEAIPYAKTGGLADVTGSLLREYIRLGKDAYLFMPLYRIIREKFSLNDTGVNITVNLGGRFINSRIFSVDERVFLIESNEFFDRYELYGTPFGDFPDNAERFIFFSMAILETIIKLGLKPDIIHCNDWQTSLIPLYLKTIYHNDFFKKTSSVLTIHNLGYQGIFEREKFGLTGLGWEWFNMEGLEFYGKLNLLKAGLISADIITTVSNRYAQEILTPEFGYGLDGVLRKRAQDLRGILNGIDTEEWNPETDRFISGHFSTKNLSNKQLCKENLIRDCNLTAIAKSAPIICFIGRLSKQKGVDILCDTAENIIKLGAGLIILGKGDAELEAMVNKLNEIYKGKIFAMIGYNEAFAHRVYAGSDIFIMPSRYEPCGLGQMIAMRYGTIPVARNTGGIGETIEDFNPLSNSGTGFLFEELNVPEMLCSIKIAITLFYCKERWDKLIKRAMAKDFSWRNSALKYIDLYETLSKRKSLG